MDPAKAKAEILKAVGNPVRITIVEALRHQDLCVRDLNREVGVRQPTLSRHLTVLKKCGILTERRAGLRVYHHLETPGILQALNCAADVVKSHTRLRERLTRDLRP